MLMKSFLKIIHVFSPEGLQQLLDTLVYAVLGIVLFGIALWLIERLTPFSVRKEIEEQHNTALAIVVAAIVLGIALIFAASISG